jgi:hypothetical protein
MHINPIKKVIAGFLIIGMAVLAADAQDNPITWGSTETVSGDSDVSTAGTLLGTWAPYLQANTNIASLTVNGVTFVANSLPDFSISNNFTILSTNMGDAGLPDANYDVLLEGAESTPITGVAVPAGFTFGGLVPGNTYQVQIWVQDVVNQGYHQWENYYEASYNSSSQGNGFTTSAAVTYPSDGTALGQYCIGTFTPTNTTETINFNPHGFSAASDNNDLYAAPQVNLVQVRGFLLPPTFTQQPLGTYDVALGGNVTLGAVAAGSPVLSYQWYETNFTALTGFALAGQTNASLTLSNLESSGNYYLVVTNDYGSTNSLTSSVVVYTSPVILSQIPVTYTNQFALYAGANPRFSVNAVGLGALAYQWFTNGVLDSAVSTNSLQFTNVQVGDFSNYCIIANSYGFATSTVWTASVIADPANSADGPAAYPQSVLTLGPVGYWRLNDVNLDGPDNGSGDFGYICHDYAGGNDGIYTNCSLGNPGYNPIADPSDTSAQFGEADDLGNDFGDSLANGIAGVNFGSSANTSVAFTVEAWVSGYIQSSDAGIVALGWGNGGEQFDLDTGANGGTPTHAFRFLIRDASGNSHSVSSSVVTTTSPSLGPWYHLVGVVDEISNQNMTLYIDGVNVGTAPIPSGSGILPSTNLLTIGSRMSSQTSNFNDQFLGNINDVAIFNYALSPGQVANEYANAGSIAPFLVPAPPTNASLNANAKLTIPVAAYGSYPLGYQWFDVNGNAIANAGGVAASAASLNATLTLSNVLGSWNQGTLELVVTNAYGVTNVFVTLNINTNVQFTLNLPPQVTVAPNEPYTYSAQAVGPAPAGYEWFANGEQIPGQSGTNYTPSTSGIGSSTYYVVVTNLIGSYMSVVSTLTVDSYPTNAYAAGILSLHPVAYWPMHEVEPWTPGDIETNYGTLGLLGTGYWPDWAANYGAFQRGYPGALAGDSDPSVFFKMTQNSAGGPTNALFVSHSSPLATLNVPFSVECWVYPTVNGKNGDIWSQSGDEGLNAGSAGGGSGSVAGIRLYWAAPGFQVYSYNDSTTQKNPIPAVDTGVTLNQWYHVVLTCDAGTNLALYINGSLAFSTNATGQYAPDYWTPFEVGNGKGNTRAFPEGAVDEVAIYTNALSASDIANHYNTGINSSPSPSYFQLVTSDHPTIYFRMDSSVYTPPPMATWPVLLNFGSVPVAGVYTPGMIPGLLPGPVHSSGAPINGLSGDDVALLSGVSSFADVGYAPAYDPVGSNAFSLVVMFRGNPSDDRFQDIIGHSDNSWRLSMNSNGHLQCTLGTNSTSVVNSAKVYNDGNWHQAVEVYQPASNPVLPGTNALFVDGIQDSGVATVSTNGIGPGSPLNVVLGGDPQYTNNSPGVGRNFAGQVCEVALFTNALTPTQIVALYDAAGGIAPSVNSTQPLTAGGAVGAGTSANFGVSASGTSPLTYQWYYNSTSNYNGTALVDNAVNYANVTTDTLTITNLTTAAAGWYYAVITNAYGSATSSLASLILVNPNPTNLVFSQTNNQLVLSWPADHIGWTLQAQTNSLYAGLSTNWNNVSSSAATNQMVMPINFTNGSVFYRLIYNP